MFHVIFHELEQHPPGPKLILGDFNGDVGDFPSLSERVNDASWYDVGDIAATWAHLPGSPHVSPHIRHQGIVVITSWRSRML